MDSPETYMRSIMDRALDSLDREGQTRRFFFIKGNGLVAVLHLPVYNYEDQYKDHKYADNNSYGEHKN